ncbi:hypothetical protein [Actinomadura madurae]|uniref:hypothetical protein n=1 Tax=Actinomadura madurae TaxID=1993 RepID=UPI0020D1FA2B|nr:hypothetical protein [Actinomadura madurae]MCP9955154.1 hypothetical protein [Actinomadura madurae]MCQ0004058.1 hypothetical protein [Actinomadura madurae]
MPLPTGLAAAALLGLLTLLATARRGRRRPRPETGHPESLTAVLDPGDEEYLAWLADHHWPGDEYLDLENEWLTELEFGEPADHYESPMCPRCNLRREDVWPCPTCGRAAALVLRARHAAQDGRPPLPDARHERGRHRRVDLHGVHVRRRPGRGSRRRTGRGALAVKDPDCPIYPMFTRPGR